LLEGIAGAYAQLSVESDMFVLNHLSVFGIFGASSAAWTYAVQLFASGLLNLRPLITHRLTLADYQRALDMLVERQPGTLKILLLHNWK
jgi:threonine dehydrogenase-like Zn-dependent dehydrogenase